MPLAESKFYHRVAELIQQGQAFKVCRVVHAVGSAPRNAGAQMVVLPDGKIEFTLGGGAIEGRVIREAVLSMDDPGAMLREYHLGDLGMHCGGIMQVMFESAQAQDLAFYRQAASLMDQRASFISAYDLNENQPHLAKAIFSESSKPFGDEVFIEKAEASAKELWASDSMYLQKADHFVNKVFPSLRLLIFGAGHVGAKLAEVAAASSVFTVDIVDDRAEFADEAKLPFCDHVLVAPHNYEGDLPLPDERTFVAVITRCHDTDKVVLKTLLNSEKPFAYLGMIGSVPKRAQLFKLLKDEGVSETKLDQVVTPMGLPIGGKEPGEIAVSMLAEMIQRKNQLDGTLEGGIVRWKRKQQAELNV